VTVHPRRRRWVPDAISCRAANAGIASTDSAPASALMRSRQSSGPRKPQDRHRRGRHRPACRPVVQPGDPSPEAVRPWHAEMRAAFIPGCFGPPQARIARTVCVRLGPCRRRAAGLPCRVVTKEEAS
jgi:hypothetical protein